eukprot:8713947-Pyramimonas_sp.AAC.1
MAPELIKAASLSKPVGVRVGAVDASAHPELPAQYGLSAGDLPALKVFAENKLKPVDYTGQ